MKKMFHRILEKYRTHGKLTFVEKFVENSITLGAEIVGVGLFIGGIFWLIFCAWEGINCLPPIVCCIVGGLMFTAGGSAFDVISQYKNY